MFPKSSFASLLSLLPLTLAFDFQVMYANVTDGSGNYGWNLYSPDASADNCNAFYYAAPGNITTLPGPEPPLSFNMPCLDIPDPTILDFAWGGVGEWNFYLDGTWGGTCTLLCQDGIEDKVCQYQLVESIKCWKDAGYGVAIVAGVLSCSYNDGVTHFC